MLQRLDRADAQHREQGEGHVRRAEVLQNIAGEGERQALPAMRGWRGDRVPALLDIGVIGGLETFGQADHTVFELGSLQIALAVERGEFPGRKLTDSGDDRFDQIGFGVLEAFGLREFVDPGVDADGKQLVGGRRGKGGHFGASFGWMGAALLAGRANEYSAGA